MLLDPAVESRKFERELALLRRNADRLARLGLWIASATAPKIDVVCVPRWPLRIAVPLAAPPPGLHVPPGETAYNAIELRAASARPFGIRLDLSGYDQRAPSVTFRDPWTWEPLEFAALPIAQILDIPSRPQIVTLDSHPVTKLPFLCMRGVREYHMHPQHDGDEWAIYRQSMNIYVLLERIARVSLASVRAQLVVVQAGAQGVQLQMQWAPELIR